MLRINRRGWLVLQVNAVLRMLCTQQEQLGSSGQDINSAAISPERYSGSPSFVVAGR